MNHEVSRMLTAHSSQLTAHSISFVIPVYNTQREFLERCINSIEAQGFDKYEIIIVNDGSTLPEVEEVCLSFAEKNTNIKYFVQANQGAAVARNTGLDNVNCEYVIFMDADDYLPENFRSSLDAITADFDILCMDYETLCLDGQSIISSLNEPMDLSSRKQELYRNILLVPGSFNGYIFGGVWTKCFSAKFIRENSLRFVPKLRRTQDRMFMLEAFYAADRINYVPIVSYIFRLNEQSITHKFNFKNLDYCFNAYSAMSKWSNEHNVSKDSSKFLGFEVMRDALGLTYLHSECRLSFWQKIRGIAEQYDRFRVREDTMLCGLEDYSSTFSRRCFLVRRYFGKWGFSAYLVLREKWHKFKRTAKKILHYSH